MARTSPLQALHQQAEAAFDAYGPREGGSVLVVQSYGELELEYAAVRKHAGLIDRPYRGLIEVTGSDRVAFLNSMLTQELKGLGAGMVRRAFWLNRKGRIDADVRVMELGTRTLLEVDVHAVERTMATLGSYIIAEDAQLTDRTGSHHALSLHGPAAGLLLGLGVEDGPAWSLEGGRCVEGTIAGVPVVVARDDEVGEPGYHLWVPVEGVGVVFQQMLERGHEHGPESGTPGAALSKRELPRTLASRVRLRPIGWQAFNMARVEAGTPWYNIDFGPESLPAETGVLMDRVSFTKGCYLGQEIVARMHARGHPKQVLVGIGFERRLVPTGPGMPDFPAIPMAGAGLWLDGAGSGEAGSGEAGSGEAGSGGGTEAVGVVTSATLGPMVGSRPIAFAQVKHQHAREGAAVRVRADGVELVGSMRLGLRFLGTGSAASV